MNSLRDFLAPMTQPERDAFAVACGTTWQHLRNCMYGTRKPSAALAAQIETESKGVVPRVVTRPLDAHLIWPGEFALAKDGSIVRRAGQSEIPNGVTVATAVCP